MHRNIVARELSMLSEDLPDLLGRARAQARQLIGSVIPIDCERIVVVGCGDSWHAGWATRAAFAGIGGIELLPLSANDFLQATPPSLESSVVVGISASGSTERVIEAMDLARAKGCRVGAISCQRDAAIFRFAQAYIAVNVEAPQPAPGIRTYQASCTALLGMAIECGLAGGRLGAEAAAAIEESCELLAAELGRQNEPLQGRDSQPMDGLLARMTSAPLIHALGSGSAFGSALHAAAKFMEIAGTPCIARDLEEWWHVDRFAFADACPLIVFIHPGEHATRQIDAVARLAARGARPFVVGSQDVMAQFANRRPPMELPEGAPLTGGFPAALQPWLDARWSAATAFDLAAALDRHPFSNPFNRK